MEAKSEPETNNIPDDDSRKVFFYGEPQRMQCLNFLMHLAPYSNDTLVITGGVGSGKSVLLKQFMHKGGEAWRTCFMAGEGLASVKELLRAIEARFSIRSLEDAPRTEQIEVLVDEFQAVQKRNQRVVLIIDDAHKASEDVLGFLDQLQEGLRRAGDGVSLVLTGDESFAAHPEVENLRVHGMHVFELLPLSMEETENYLRNFLRKKGMPTDALSSGEMKRIYKEAKGNFALTFSLARNAVGKGRHRLVLGGAEESDATPSVEPSQAVVVPRSRYFVPLSVLLVFAILVANQFGSIPLPDWLSEKEPTVEPSSPSEPTTGGVDEVEPPPAEEDTPSFHALEEEYAPVTQPGPPEALTDAFDQLALEEPSAPVVLAEDGIVPIVPPVEEAAVATPPEIVEPEVQSVPAVEALTPPVPQAPLVVIPAPEVVAPPPPVAVEPLAITTQAEPPAVTETSPAPAETPPAPAGPRDEAWLLAQGEKKYTLQIMALNTDKTFKKMLAKVDNPSAFAIYRLMRNDKLLYALVYGVFDSSADAQAAVADLPKSLGKVSPLAKRMRDVQKDIRAAPP